MKKLAVITGASSGFGRELAKIMSEKGYPLLLLARRISILEDLNLPHTLCRKVNVQSFQEIQVAIQEAEAQFGPVDLMVNNAGVMLLSNELGKQNPQEWEQMIQTNVFGVLNGIRAVIEGMKKRNNGTIINISSTAGHKTYPTHSVYSATKFAVRAFSEGLRQEVASHFVRVCTVSPGIAETELLSHTTSEAVKESYQKTKKTMMGGVLSALDVAKVILSVYEQPQHVCIRDLIIAPTGQER